MIAPSLDYVAKYDNVYFAVIFIKAGNQPTIHLLISKKDIQMKQ